LSESASKRPIKPGDHLYLIDGSGYIFRAYHALPPLSRKSDGLPTGAVAGFSNMLWKLLEDTKAGDKPSHLAVIFDAGRFSFRNDFYPEYKANRDEPPEDLVPQFALVRDATRAFGAPAVEMKGYEADDLIATYARQAFEAGARVTIVSSDKDLMQLVRDGKVEMLDTMKNKRIGPDEVVERFGVKPDKVIEVQALAGDSTDNVPGVPGIGVKTAALLINEYGDLETLLERAEEIKQQKRRQALIDNAEKARLSKRLVTLDDNVPVEVSIDVFGVHDPETDALLPFLKEMEFSTLGKRAASALGVADFDSFAGKAATVSVPASTTKTKPAKEEKPQPRAEADKGGTPGLVIDADRYRAKFDHASYELITDLESLNALIDAAVDAGSVAQHFETASGPGVTPSLVGIGFAFGPGKASYLPLGHSGGGLALGESTSQVPEKEALSALRKLFEDESILKVGHDIKTGARALLVHGIRLNSTDDPMLMSYVKDAGLNGHSIEELSEIHLGHKALVAADLLGKGRDKKTFADLPPEDAKSYAAERADIALRLSALLKPALVAVKRVTVYETLERPLIPVLAEMENAGILVDPDFLKRLSNDFAKEMDRLEKELHKLAGEAFNLGSPKQLGEILFDKLSLPGGKRTKTGAWSTDAGILEELAAQGHDLPARILEWRQLSKLKSNYTDALPQHINSETGRVHTSYALATTTTGRLSSIDPNLQNIPIRTEEGRRIRQAFVAPKGRCLISADYSQIELRLLAHIADVPTLSKAFADGTDIHAMTASEMFGVPVKGMPPEIRRRAKAINFGIIYGISAFGLANQLSIPRGDADAYIKKYFQRFPGIRDYMEETREFVREYGYVETFFRRRIHIKDVQAKSAAHRAFGERQAINAPLQGSAADIIRRAMVRLPGALKKAKLDAQLLLQVHDELVIEAKKSDADSVCKIAREVMENAAMPALQLKVPLEVEARAGANWDEAH
jgi:DNA polymerase-1